MNFQTVPNRSFWCSLKMVGIGCALWSLVILFAPLVHAQQDVTGIDPSQGETLITNPKIRINPVTATVVDSIPPTVPILIAPTDGQSLTTILPTFIWQPSTDEQGIAKYQLYLDSSLLFDTIPTGNTTNSFYTLIVEDGEMKLTVKNGLSQGSHTWSIVAFDINSNSTTSATWGFTIDSQAPTTIVTKIGTATTAISSADSGSVPSQPVHSSDNEPVISGTSESGATLHLTLVVPGDGTFNYTQTLSGSTFSFPFGTLPTNVTMHFTIVSQDALGNSSTIADVPFVVDPLIIIIPPTPSPGPATPTPEPTQPGETPVPGTTETPTPQPTTPPLIEVEVPRPTEIIKEITKPPEKKRLPIIDDLIAASPLLQEIVDTPLVKTISEALPALSVVAPVVVTVATATQTSTSLLYPIFDILTKLLQAIGLIPKRKAHGVVYDSENGSAIAFATVNIYTEDQPDILDSVISDEYGVYNSIKLARGTYHIVAVHADYRFPTLRTKPTLATIFDFYKGESFKVADESQEQFLLIPMDARTKETMLAGGSETRRSLVILFINRLIGRLFYPMAIFSWIVTLFFPTLLNVIISGLYLLLWIVYVLKRREQPLVHILVTDPEGHPLTATVIRIADAKTNTLVGIRITDPKGTCTIRLPQGDFSVRCTTAGYLPTQDGQAVDSFYVHHQSSESVHYTMTPMEKLQFI